VRAPRAGAAIGATAKCYSPVTLLTARPALLSRPLANAEAANPTPSELAWRVIGLLSLYRLVVPLMLLAMESLAGPSWGRVAAYPRLFVAACIAYFTAAVLLVIARRLEWSSLRIVALVNASVDTLAVALILYASGGVASGLGILLVLPVLALTVLAGRRDALLIAAVAALGVLVQQVFTGITDSATPTTDYTTAGVLGVVLFIVGALLTWPVANYLRESEALVRRQELDLANLAQLSQYIVQHLRESILVIDAQDRIRLINESAAEMLGDQNAYPDALIGEASPRLLFLLESWRQGAAGSGELPSLDPTFVGADGARLIRAHFAPLGTANPGPLLIFLEDTSLIAEKVQQSKLAALGRLSASIAHEIRNPVGAMSHAAQLLAESPQLAEEDRRLTQIIRGNAERVSGIIDNVQRLARREPARLERLSLAAWTEEFRAEFCETMQWPPAQLPVRGEGGEGGELEVRVDPDQLRQIIWNLCDNALKHAAGPGPAALTVEIRYGRMVPNARPFLEIADRGPGVAAEHVERIFEPFYSGGRGTGLGLFLARELAQTNGATLLYEPRQGGGSVFRLVFADPRRWEI
jgi:two-component system, NtrC family, sensor histidine kinase PilS